MIFLELRKNETFKTKLRRLETRPNLKNQKKGGWFSLNKTVIYMKKNKNNRTYG